MMQNDVHQVCFKDEGVGNSDTEDTDSHQYQLTRVNAKFLFVFIHKWQNIASFERLKFC